MPEFVPVRQVYPAGVLYCEGAGRHRLNTLTTCDGGDLFRGRRARWVDHRGRLLCGTCKKAYAASLCV